MKSVKKYVAFILTMVFALSLMTVGVSAEESADVIVKKNINLALHKEILSSSQEADSQRLTDGLYNQTAVSGTAEEGETFTVDLGRLACVTDVLLWPSQSGNAVSGSKMSDVALEVSADNVLWKTVGVQGTVTASLTKDSVFKATLEDGEFYRYIRVRKTSAGSYEYGELEVFADVNAIEVSRGKEVTADRESSAAPTAYSWASVVDGNTTAYGWLVETASSEEKCLSIDMGKEVYADWIEMYSRRTYAAPSYRKDWEVYGLSEDDSENILSPKGVGTKLFAVNATDSFEGNFPANVEANDPNNHLFETIDSSVGYRYFSFYKPKNLIGLAEVGIYTIIPEAVKAEMNAKTLTVYFTEEMDAETFDNMTIRIDGKEVMEDIVSEDGFSASVDFDEIYYGSRVDVVIPETVKNAKGTSVIAKVETCYFPQAIETSEPVFLNGTTDSSEEITSLSGNTSAGVKMTFKNNQPEKAEDVIMVVALYDKNHTITKMAEKKITIDPDSGEITLIAGVELPSDTEGCRLSVFVWKEYRYMSPWFIHKSIN